MNPFALLALPDINELIKTLMTFVLIGGFIGGTVYGGAVRVRKIKKDAAEAERSREEKTQERIRAAVEEERQRCRENREADDDRIKRLREIAEEWQSLAGQREERNRLLVAEVKELRAEQERIKVKHNEVVELYVGSQATIKELEKRIASLEQHHAGCTT